MDYLQRIGPSKKQEGIQSHRLGHQVGAADEIAGMGNPVHHVADGVGIQKVILIHHRDRRGDHVPYVGARCSIGSDRGFGHRHPVEKLGIRQWREKAQHGQAPWQVEKNDSPGESFAVGALLAADSNRTSETAFDQGRDNPRARGGSHKANGKTRGARKAIQFVRPLQSPLSPVASRFNLLVVKSPAA